MKPLNRVDFENAIETLGLQNKSVCIHSSMKSFGAKIDCGIDGMIDAFLNKNCTILTPTFSYDFEAKPTPKYMPNQNGIGDGSYFFERELPAPKYFTTKTKDLSTEDMGLFPKTVLENSKSRRGFHSLNSFTALGKNAKNLVENQTNRDVYAPFERLLEDDGYILLMGVDLTRATIIHYAELLAGRNLFVRWAYDENFNTIPVLVGSCSEGFNKLTNALKNIGKEIFVGKSKWVCYKARDIVEICTQEIKRNPQITHCDDKGCDRCNDMMLGGPIISADFFEK